MTTLQMATPAPAEVPDTPAAQEARWNAWKSRGEAADRITQRRMRIACAVLLITLVCVMIAVVL